MIRVSAAALALALLTSGCTHPEDRRWTRVSSASSAPADEAPSVSVYAFSPPKAGGKTGIKDFSDKGQAALIAAIANSPAQAGALRKALATPLEADENTSGAVDRSRLSRTVVISVRKGIASQPGDRLMRTVITIKPRKPADETGAPFEFASYSVVATDTKVQNIAQLETTTNTKLTASVAPEIKGFGDNSIGAEVGQSRKSTADVVQQYENLGVDILPDRIIITRESERGLDVVGNTLIALTLAASADSERTHTAFLAGAMKLYENGKILPEATASLEVKPLSFFARCDLTVDVTLHYQLRRVTKGREFYTEGKQEAEIVSATGPTTTQTLVRAADAQGALYQIRAADGSAVLVTLPGVGQRRLVFDSFDEAKRMASWLGASQRASVGSAGVGVTLGSGPLPAGQKYQADFYSVGCPAPAGQN